MDKSLKLVKKINRDIAFKGFNKGECAQLVADVDIEEQRRKLKQIVKKDKLAPSVLKPTSPNTYKIFLDSRKQKKVERRIKKEKKKKHLERICKGQ